MGIAFLFTTPDGQEWAASGDLEVESFQALRAFRILERGRGEPPRRREESPVAAPGGDHVPGAHDASGAGSSKIS